MQHNPKSHSLGRYFDLPSRWRWVVWAVLMAGVATIMVTVVLWPNPIALLIEICVTVAALIALAAVIYEFDWLIFKATQPRREDLSSKPTHEKEHP